MGRLALAAAAGLACAAHSAAGLVSAAPAGASGATTFPATVSLPAGLTSVNFLRRTYASFTIDSSCNRGFHATNFTNKNLAAAAFALRPSTIRFGGSGNDGLVYGLTPGSPECSAVQPPNPADCSFGTAGCLNATQWDALYGLSVAAGADFLFGVSFDLGPACEQGPRYAWNATNAASLLDYLVAHGQRVWGFELGNEVSLGGPGTGCNLQPHQQADALLKLAGMVQAAGGPLADAVFVGPDSAGNVTQQLTWLNGYYPLLPPLLLTAGTFHEYNGATQANYNSPAQLDSSAVSTAWFVNVTRTLAPAAEVWAGEVGPHGGGDDGSCLAGAICGTYASTLWYADDLGMRARYFQQHQRQDLFGGAYGLTNSPTGVRALGPNDPLVLRPDFWVNFLFKRTMGTSAINATSTAAAVRSYAFAGAPPSPYAAAECVGSPLKLLIVNLDNATSAAVSLPAVPSAGGSFAAWSLTPAPGQGPFTTYAAINGQMLPTQVDVSVVDPSGFLGAIVQPPTTGSVSGGVTLPPISSTFLCYTGQ